MPLKVLIIQNRIPPYRIPFFEELAKVYDITVLFFLGNPGPVKFKTQKFDGGTFRLSHIHFTPGVYRIARNYDCVVIMFDLWWLNLSLLPFMLETGKPQVILWGHGIGRTSGSKIATYLRGLVAAKARALIFYTEETKRFFQKKVGISEEKCFVANNTMLVEQPPLLETNEQRNCFMYLGRIQKRKRIDELLMAYARLENDVRMNYKVLIVGDGPEEELTALRQLAARLEISANVIFEPGTYQEKKVCACYSRALAYVSPGHVGLGVVQSFAHGVPVVTARDASHAPEFVHCGEANSYLYTRTAYDTESAVNNLRDALLDIVADRKTWQERSQAAYATYRDQCSIARMVAGFSAAIEYSRTSHATFSHNTVR